jgi:hypothetical protein
MNKKSPETLILVLAGAVFFLVSLLLTNSADDFKSTLRGVAYEGLIFASLLALILKSINSGIENRRRELLLKEKTQSRDSLIKIISILCEAYHEGGIFHWTKLIKNADTFERNFELFKKAKIKQKSEMEEKISQKFFKNCCEQNLPIVLANIPIAEKISPRHLDIWVGICSIVSLTSSDSVFPEILLNEFEEHVAEFAKLKVTIAE